MPTNDNEITEGFFCFLFFLEPCHLLSKQCQGHTQHHFEVISGSGVHLGFMLPVETPGASVVQQRAVTVSSFLDAIYKICPF